MEGYETAGKPNAGFVILCWICNLTRRRRNNLTVLDGPAIFPILRRIGPAFSIIRHYDIYHFLTNLCITFYLDGVGIRYAVFSKCFRISGILFYELDGFP